MVTLPNLYPHQEDLRDRTRLALAKHGRVILTAPPGCGKTRMAKWILGASANREPKSNQSGKSLFTVHRRGLVENAADSFSEEPRLPHGVVMSGVQSKLSHRVQVASIDTLLSWFVDGKNGYDSNITFDLICWDECHSHGPKFARFLQYHNKRRKELGLHPAYVIGLTATPQANGLADVYKEIVQGPSTKWLIENKFLSPFRYFRATTGNLSLLKKRGGEFTKDSEAAAMDGLAGDLVRDWKKHAEGRPTVGFFPRRSHAQEAMEELRAAGLRVEYVDGETSDESRKRIFWELNEHRIDYICNVQVIERGTDIPSIACVQLCVAIGSLTRYLQMIGRGSRVHPEKTDCVARGTMILTDRGEVPIENLRRNDKVWDGCNFVSHGGTICKGIKNVITYSGLTATPDHLVKTEDGWRTFGECARKRIPIIQTGFSGKAVRECENNLTRNRASERLSLCQGSVRHLFARAYSFLGQLAWRANKRVSPLQSAETIPEVALSENGGAAAALYKSKRFKIQRLWRSWDMLQLPVSFRSLFVGQGKPRNPSGQTVGQNRQRWSLPTRKPALVYSSTKPVTHEENAIIGGDAQISPATPGCTVCRLDTDETDRFGANIPRDQGPIPQSPVNQTEREVWDILNAGPLHRFTAQGLLVHNCLILDHGGNVQRHGFFEDQHQWTLDVTTKDPGEQGTRPTIECPNCSAIYRGGKCRQCGYEPTPKERKSQGLEFDGTELREVKPTEKKEKSVRSAHDIMVSVLYRAGLSGRTWKQAVGLFYKECEKQGTRHRVPKTVSVAGQDHEMLRYGSPDGGRKVSALYPFTVGKVEVS